MVAEQLRPHGVTDERVLEAMASVPREEFLSPRMRRHAYEDRALAIDCGQTISQPLVVALMVQDRKSTRLNSSHGYISYAVICLEKKEYDIDPHILSYSESITLYISHFLSQL